MFSLKQLIGGAQSTETATAREREIAEVKSVLSDSIQAIQSGNRILSTMSGMIELQRSKPS